MEVEAGRVDASLRGEALVVVYQGDGRSDVHVHGTRRLQGPGRERTQRLDLRAEAVVLFFERPEALAGIEPAPERLPVRALYARGFVRLELAEGDEPPLVLEAAEVGLDFVGERARLRDVELRLPRTLAGRGGLGTSLVLRATSLLARGADDLEAREASLSPCDHGRPHVAVGGRRVTVRSTAAPPPPPPPVAAALGGVGGAAAALASRPPPLFSGLLPRRGRVRTPAPGSDALARMGETPRLVRVEGAALFVLGARIPLSPLVAWGTDWPRPIVEAGSSNKFGVFGRLGARFDLGRLDLGSLGGVDLAARATVDAYERRGVGGSGGVEWRRRDAAGDDRGQGFLRFDGLRDRADEDRVGTPFPDRDRFWLRGLLRERLAPAGGVEAERPLRVVLDAELSRFSDPGYLLEYHRSVSKTEKEQETYAHLRASWDDLALRVLGRAKVNDFQDQVERFPEARLDWIETPLAAHSWLGALGFDAALRAGALRRSPPRGGARSYRAARADGRARLTYKNALGPFLLRAWAGGRETFWDARSGSPRDIERHAAEAGWTLGLPLWSALDGSWGMLRHDVLFEVGTRHRFAMNREPHELLFFDEEVEGLRETDHLLLRVRTRLSTYVDRRPRKLIDLAAEVRHFLSDRGRAVAGTWSSVALDLRLDLSPWVALRARWDQPTHGGKPLEANVRVSLRPVAWLRASASFLQLGALSARRTLAWDVAWRLNPSWGVAVSQQVDLERGDFLRHAVRVVRTFHRFALVCDVQHDPDQDDTSVSLNFVPLLAPSDDPLGLSGS
ncbi:MAG: hypothetical protein D6731_00750 [Planctomycetota bacterium]|nr:MAG: hypothetical protein D6731_00750 [Planctomycetota bacterium]